MGNGYPELKGQCQTVNRGLPRPLSAKNLQCRRLTWDRVSKILGFLLYFIFSKALRQLAKMCANTSLSLSLSQRNLREKNFLSAHC
jgi:hypothetical protein